MNGAVTVGRSSVNLSATVATSPTARPSTPSEGAFQRKCLKAFNALDTSGDGFLSIGELQQALARFGLQLSAREFRALVAEIDQDGDQRLGFKEFQEMVRKVMASQAGQAGKQKNRIPRLYLAPDAYTKYVQTFRQKAGDDGFMSVGELEAFFRERKMSLTKEKMSSIMREVDSDNSGFLDEAEFLLLMSKAGGSKKRKVGPGQCSLASLVDEGWNFQDLKKIGYDVRDFVEESKCSVADLFELFSVAELRKAGKTFDELLSAGWDALDARAAGFQLPDLLQAGCSLRKVRTAGWDDAASAVQLRKLGVDARRMRAGGWRMSELRAAGYSTGALRAAGFAPTAVAALQMVAARQDQAAANRERDDEDAPLERRTTLRILQELKEQEERGAPSTEPTGSPRADGENGSACSGG